MYGKRARIGLIVPPTNTVIEEEFHRMAPEGVSIHTARATWEDPQPQPDSIIKMSESVADAAQRAAMAEVGTIVWGCTGGSFMKGVGFDQELISQMEERTGIPSLTTSTAVIEAFKEFGFESVAVATPYVDAVNEREKIFFEGHGFKVTKIKGLQLPQVTNIGLQEPSVSYSLAKEVDSPEADGVFISCTDFRTIDILSKLEEELDKPAVSSNQASMWASLKRVGIQDPIKGFGSLLTRSR